MILRTDDILKENDPELTVESYWQRSFLMNSPMSELNMNDCHVNIHKFVDILSGF